MNLKVFVMDAVAKEIEGIQKPKFSAQNGWYFKTRTPLSGYGQSQRAAWFWKIHKTLNFTWETHR